MVGLLSFSKTARKLFIFLSLQRAREGWSLAATVIEGGNTI
jgi:hypothetical protein